MSHAQKYLAQANRHIAELKVQIVRQRVIVKDALNTGHSSEMAESLLDAVEGSLRIFEKHRELILRACTHKIAIGSAIALAAANDVCGLRHRKFRRPSFADATKPLDH
jgi:hypothetical protein